MEELMFPNFDYHLDESDPDVVIVCRQDEAFVAAFSARVPPRRASSKLPGRIIGSLSGLTLTRLLSRAPVPSRRQILRPSALRSSEKFAGGGLRGSRVGEPKKIGSKGRVWNSSLGGNAAHLGGRLSVF